jgi:DNA end-binding protein Ku
MAIRANWKGYLKLSLVSCAVGMVPATSTRERTRFHNLNRATGNRLRQRMVDEETGEEVPREERIKGYEAEKGRYIQVEDEELEQIALESTHTIEVESFVPRTEIDERYIDQPYYLIPNDKVSEEAFVVIREAMRDEKRVALARVVLYGRERVVKIEPLGKGMLVTTLRYAYEVRDEKPIFDDIPDKKVAKEMLELARHIIEQKADHFKPEKFKDRYETSVVGLLRKKEAGETIERREAPRPSNVINLMDALRKSVATERGQKTSGRASERGTARRTPKRAPSRRGSSRTRPRKAS